MRHFKSVLHTVYFGIPLNIESSYSKEGVASTTKDNVVWKWFINSLPKLVKNT